MTRHPIPSEVIQGLDVIAAEIARVRAAVATGHATLGSLKAAEQAAVRLRNAVPVLVTAARRARIEAERAERQHAARGPEIIDERIEQMRREERRSDLSIPSPAA